MYVINLIIEILFSIYFEKLTNNSICAMMKQINLINIFTGIPALYISYFSYKFYRNPIELL